MSTNVGGDAAKPFVVAEACVQLGLRAGAIAFHGVRVAAAHEGLRDEIAAAIQKLLAAGVSPAIVRSLPEVLTFQGLLRKAGVNPRKDQPSVERLLAYALKRGQLPAINTLVDAYNLVSIRTRCSLGAHDLDKIILPVALRLLNGAETFTPLGRDTPAPVTPGEYAYVDGANRVLCRLDILQAEFSKVTTDTRNALLIVEGTTVHSSDSLRQVFQEAIQLVTHYCGGTATIVAFPDR